MVNELMAKEGIIFHDFWGHFFLMVNPDHLIFGINSNVMANGGRTEKDEEDTDEHKFQFCHAFDVANPFLLS